MSRSQQAVGDKVCHLHLPSRPLHGLAERFTQMIRVLADKGVVDFDEKWGYQVWSRPPPPPLVVFFFSFPAPVRCATSLSGSQRAAGVNKKLRVVVSF